MPFPVMLAPWIFMIAVPLVFQVLIGLGGGFVVYQGINLLFKSVVGDIKLNLAGISVDISAHLQFLGIYDAIGILLGGVAASLMVKSFSSFRLRRNASPLNAGDFL